MPHRMGDHAEYLRGRADVVPAIEIFISATVTCPGAVADSGSSGANVKNAPNFLAKTRLISPASPMHKAIVGRDGWISSFSASRFSRIFPARQTILFTSAGSAFISPMILLRSLGLAEKSWALIISRDWISAGI